VSYGIDNWSFLAYPSSIQGGTLSDKLKIGVIGVGHLGRAHVKILSQIESCELIGCHDIVTEKAEAAATEFCTKSFVDVSELIENCDAISLVTTTSEHHRCALDILNAGKHLFVEKPIATTVEQARGMIDLAKRNDLKLMVGHIERFNPAVIALADKIEYPSFIEAHRLASFNFRGLDVAVIFDLMIHDIDLCLHLTGSKVIDIQASAAAVVSEHMDIANARLSFESGCVANLTASRISPKAMRKVRIFQPKGYISIDLDGPSAEVYRLLEQGETIGETNGFSTAVDFGETGKKIAFNKPPIDSYDMLTAELSSFIDSVQHDTPVAVSGEEASEALQVATDIERIAEAGIANLRSRLR
jgi:predicted dehydrogenase